MNRAFLTLSFASVCWFLASGQKPNLELTFTSINDSSYTQLDSIKIINRTKACDTLLYFPDTVLVLDYMIGYEESVGQNNGLVIKQNYPNPVLDETKIEIRIPEPGLLKCFVSDINGWIVERFEANLEKGTHIYKFIPGTGNISFFSVTFGSERKTIKIVHASRTSNSPLLEYDHYEHPEAVKLKDSNKVMGFHFDPGDMLTYIGYTANFESGIKDIPIESDTIVFQFAYNIPCPGMPTVTYEGQVYNTVQIFNQCWIKENLNAGTIISSWSAQQNNGVVEKYCYADYPSNCDQYGALYLFQEMMNYYPVPGSQGICPDGWHIPSDDDFMILEAMADSLYGIGDPIWEQTNFRGYDAGINLKSSQGWFLDGNGIDKYGFSCEPGGMIGYNEYGFPNHLDRTISGHLWTSNKAYIPPQGWNRVLDYNRNDIQRVHSYISEVAFSIRCLRDH